MKGKSGGKIFCLRHFIVFFWFFFGVSAQAADYYVDKTAGSDGNAGTSWVQAKATIQAAINLAAAAGDRVLVAAGTYNEGITFPSLNNFQLLGGYPSGGGTQDPWTNATIIDGTGLTGSVVYIPGNFGTSLGYTALVLDGFTIQNGTKSGYYGTGIESWSVDLTIKRCLVQNNTNTGGYVGGIYVGALSNEFFSRTLRIEQSIIRNNSGPGTGGIVVDAMGYPTVVMTNNLVYGNQATASGSPWSYGTGGIAVGTGAQEIYSTLIMNCTIADNTSAHSTPVGGISVNLDYSDVHVTNSIIWNGQDDIYNYPDGYSTIHLSYSDISDAGDTGTGVIHTDPAFVGAGDYHLTSGSGGCIDGGTATGAPSVDLEGTARPQGTGWDMGAYEYSAPLVQYTLTTSVIGGHGTILPPGGDYDGGTDVALLATPDAGYRVASWSGTNDDASVFMNNQVTMDGDKSVSVSFALIPYGAWTTDYGDVAGADGNDYARGIAFDHNGQVLAVGEEYTGFGTNSNGYDAYGVRYDTEGALVDGNWPVIFHSSAYDQRARFYSTAVDSRNNVLLAGEDMESSFYYQRFSLWKYAEDGTLLWQKTYRSDAWNYAKDVCVDSNDNIFAVGETFTHWGEPYWDWRIERWTPAGDSSIRFNVDIASSESFYVRDWAEGVVCDGEDNIVVAGKKAMSSQADNDLYADEDWHVRKYPNNLDNDAGTAGYQPIWEFTYRPSGLGNNGFLRDTAMDVAEDSAGNVYVVGYISQGTDNTAANRDIRGQIIKLSKDGDGAGTGTMIGAPVYYGEGRQSAATAVAVDDQNKVYVGGWIYNGTDYLWCLETYDTDLNLVDTQEWSDLKGGILDIATQGSKVALTGYFDNRALGAETVDNDWKVMVFDGKKKFPWSMFLPTIIKGNQ